MASSSYFNNIVIDNNMILVIDSVQVVFMHPYSSSRSSNLLQLVTPLLLSQRILKQELKTSVREITIGSRRRLLLSTHLEHYTLLIFDHDKSYFELKTFHKAVKDVINLICGPSWSHLKTTPLCNEAVCNYIDTWNKLVLENPHFALGLTSRPLFICGQYTDHLVKVIGKNDVIAIIEKDGCATQPLDSSRKQFDLVSALVVLSRSKVCPLTGLTIVMNSQKHPFDQYFVKVVPNETSKSNVIILENAINSMANVNLVAVVIIR